MSNDSPRPPGAPPKPPPRRPDRSEQSEGPFMAADAFSEAPTPDMPVAVNPFLAATPTPASERSQQVVPPSQGAPLRVQRGVALPNVSDPHAEFRRGAWKKPLLMAVLAAAIVGGLFLGLPEQEPDKPGPFADSASGPVMVIGASVSPEVIPDPDRPSLQNPNPERKRPRSQEPPPAPVDRPDRSGSFGDVFKSSAK